MAGQTNIIVDGSSEMNLMKAIIDYINKKMNGSPSDKLKKEFAKWLGDKGLESCVLTIVKNQVATDLEDKIIKANIPYMTMKTPVGVAFIVKDEDKERFMQMQYDVLSMRPEFYAACTVNQAVARAKSEHQQQMAHIQVGSQSEAEELVSRINQEGKGVVASICHNPANGPFRYDVLININDAVKKNGADIVRLELQWALKQGDRDIFDMRSDQAAYDLNEMKIMLLELGMGHGVSIVDQMNTSDIRVDITPNGAVFKKRDQYGGWNEERRIPDDEGFTMPVFDVNDAAYHTSENKSRLAQFEMAMRAGIKDIRNMRVVTIEDADRMCCRTIEQAMDDIRIIDNLNNGINKYKYGSNQDNSGMFIPIMNVNRPTRPDISRNCNINNAQKRNYAWYKDKGESMVEAINEEAHRQALMVPGFDMMSPQMRRQVLIHMTEEILQKKELPTIKEYLYSPEAPTGTELFYENFVKNFTDQREVDGLNVDFLALSEIEGQPNRFKDYVVEIEEADKAKRRIEKEREREKEVEEEIEKEEEE